MSLLRVTDIEKSFAGNPVLRGVSLEVAAGGITAILGPSGCGKTTLLRLIAGFLRPDGGVIEIDGRPVSAPSRQVPPEDRRLGYLAQEGALFPHLTVAKNIAFGLPRRARADTWRLTELLELVSLDTGLLGRYPHQLSGGQQQRVALARTLAPEPRLVLLDEPFSALDASLRAETRALVAAALSATGVTTLLVTHDQEEALSFADQIAVMRSGELAQVGEPRVIYDDPVDLPTAEFIGDACLLKAVVRGDNADSALGTVPVRRPTGGRGVLAGPAILMLRPEQLSIRPIPGGVSSIPGGVPSIPGGVPSIPGGISPGPGGVRAAVSAVEYFGHDCLVTAEVAAGPGIPPITVTSRRLAGAHLEPGDAVAISVIGTGLAFPASERPMATLG